MSDFEEDPPRVIGSNDEHEEADRLLLNIDGYEGPIDVLLDMARTQKVDLMQISILQLVRQYLVFVERAKHHRLDLAADYLVMAAWLAYLKSRLLLPKDETGGQPDLSAAAMAEALQFQLRRLEAMRRAAETLMKRPQRGQSIFTRGAPEGLPVTTKVTYDVQLLDVLKAYGNIRQRTESQTYELPVFKLMSMDNALQRLTKMLGRLPRGGQGSVWATLESFLPEGIRDRLYGRSAAASTFTAGLELAKQGVLEVRQDGLFCPIYLRQTSNNKT